MAPRAHRGRLRPSQGHTPDEQTGLPPTLDPIDDAEARLAYVAVTRTRQRLDLGGLSWIHDHPDGPRSATTTPVHRRCHSLLPLPGHEARCPPDRPASRPAPLPGRPGSTRGPAPARRAMDTSAIPMHLTRAHCCGWGWGWTKTSFTVSRPFEPGSGHAGPGTHVMRGWRGTCRISLTCSPCSRRTTRRV